MESRQREDQEEGVGGCRNLNNIVEVLSLVPHGLISDRICEQPVEVPVPQVTAVVRSAHEPRRAL